MRPRLMFDVLTENRVKSELKTELFGQKVFAFWRIGSTNDFAYSRASQGEEEGSLVIAEQQERGRGRKSRKWESQFGNGLWFSLILRPDILSSRSGLIPYVAGISIANAVEKITGLKPDLKWPNDILLNGKKFCGILSEVQFSNNKVDFLVVGVGINVNHKRTEWSTEIKEIATSLRIEANKRVDRAELLAEVLLQLEQNYEYVKINNFEQLLNEWKQHCSKYKKNITIVQEDEIYEGIFHDLDGDGCMILKTNDGEMKKIVAGDVMM